jgi:hypothetical protein
VAHYGQRIEPEETAQREKACDICSVEERGHGIDDIHDEYYEGYVEESDRDTASECDVVLLSQYQYIKELIKNGDTEDDKCHLADNRILYPF